MQSSNSMPVNNGMQQQTGLCSLAARSCDTVFNTVMAVSLCYRCTCGCPCKCVSSVTPRGCTKRHEPANVQASQVRLFHTHRPPGAPSLLLTAWRTSVTRATCGLVYLFAGIDDPYEEPEAPELTLDARDASGKLQSVTAMAATVLQYLEQHHYLQAPEPHHTRTDR